MKTLDYIKDFFIGFLDLCYPIKCCSCAEITRNGDDICASCREGLEYINLDKRCKVCGNEKDECSCSAYVHRYTELLSVFKYDGTAKRIMLRYKISKKRNIANFFYKEMALYFKQAYSDINFDEICFVPVTRKSYNVRGFNQSKLIAQKLSKLLGLPVSDSIKVVLNKKLQHKSVSYKERLENSRNKYACKYDHNGKIILLIDDIATTGATLDDCARALLFAGAKEVYCLVAASSPYKKQKTAKDGDK